MFKHNTLKEMQQVEAHDKGDNLNGKKKRGRKPDANHLTKARKRIQTLRQEYKVRQKNMSLPERIKLRNVISALQSRIQKKEEGNHLHGELTTLKERLWNFVDAIGDYVDEKNHQKIIESIQRQPYPKPLAKSNKQLDAAFCCYFDLQDPYQK